jgi:amidase
VNKYLSRANANVKSLAEVIEFNKKNEEKVMPFFKQETLESCQAKGGLHEKEFTDAIGKRPSVLKMINSIMDNHMLDAICGTSTGLPHAIDVVNGDYGTGFYFCPPAAVAGFPHITVPMGKVHELPVGLSFMSKAFHEGELLSIAYAFEQATRKREAPEFLKSSIPL